MKIIITGASGYLGSQLSNALADVYEVTAVVRSSSSTKRITNPLVKIMVVNNISELSEIFNYIQPNVVINTVALYGRKHESSADLVFSNIEYPCQLLELSENHGVSALIHTGTSLPDEVSNYALTKNVFVKLAEKESLSATKFINIALEHFYGEGDDSSKFISYVIRKCLNGDDLQLTEGVQRRDFIHIDDVISAYRYIIINLEKLNSKETIPLGNGNATHVRDVVEMIKRLSHSESNLAFGAVQMRENELMLSCANTMRLEELGWKSCITLENGLQKTIEGERNKSILLGSEKSV